MADESPEDMIAELNARLRQIMRTAEDPKVVILAIDRITKLFGLNKPIKFAHTDPTGEKPYNVRAAMKGATDEELRTLKAFRDRMVDLGAGEN